MEVESGTVGRLAESHIATIFNRMGWIPNKPVHDTGLDLHVEIPASGSLQGSRLFGVQIKATTQLRMQDGSVVSRSVEPHRISRWLNLNIPVLFVWCAVAEGGIDAWLTWVEEYVYGTLALPLGEDLRESLVFKIPLANRLTSESAQDILSHVAAWAPVSSTRDNIVRFRKRQAETIRADSIIRKGLFKWDLFSLPITYIPRGPGHDVATNVDDWLRQLGRTVVLLGKPGSGKTITLRRVLADLTLRQVPVDLRPMLPNVTRELRYAVRAAIPILTDRQFEYLEARGQLMIVLDGLSEFKRVEDAASQIAELSRTWSSTRFIVTCRTAHCDLIRQKLPGFEEWEIADLDAGAQDRFLSTQSEEIQAAMQRAFSRWSGLRDLCANQFLFLIATEMLPQSLDEHLDRTGLYHIFLRRFMEWMSVQDPDVMIDRLSTIAWRMRKSGIDRVSALQSDLTRWLSEELGTLGAEAFEPRLYEQGLIEQAGERCRFFQETLQEYLCAHHLVRERILPCAFESTGEMLQYEGVEISELIRGFYVDLACLSRVCE